MKHKKSFFLFAFLILIGFLIYKYRNDIIIFIYNETINEEIKEKAINYERDYDFMFVKRTDSFIPKNYQEILDIFYTILNRGYDTFTFYCHPDYQNCVSDIQNLASNQEVLSNINNYVHPYNSYRALEIKSSSLGQVEVKVEKMYSDEEITTIDQKITTVLEENIEDSMSLNQKIKVIHDYIINNTKYDVDSKKIVQNQNTFYQYDTNKATGPVRYQLALCGGYTDYMMLFLEKLQIKSFKVSSIDHIWNAVWLDNGWYHLDLTWDDPITSTNENLLLYDYFLISDDNLASKNNKEHQYENNYFKELKGGH